MALSAPANVGCAFVLCGHRRCLHSWARKHVHGLQNSRPSHSRARLATKITLNITHRCFEQQFKLVQSPCHSTGVRLCEHDGFQNFDRMLQAQLPFALHFQRPCPQTTGRTENNHPGPAGHHVDDQCRSIDIHSYFLDRIHELTSPRFCEWREV